ncbi:hypothetical protein [Streptomyces sp. NPDC005283]|uniref:hypothetical protein n=1 Tax=Streptomyces sp. NPDC005283 TaxID=3156871 RepID=UPI003456E501
MLFLVPADAAAELVEVRLDDGVSGAAGPQFRDGTPFGTQCPQVVGSGAGEAQVLPDRCQPAFGVIGALLVPRDLLQRPAAARVWAVAARSKALRAAMVSGRTMLVPS